MVFIIIFLCPGVYCVLRGSYYGSYRLQYVRLFRHFLISTSRRIERLLARLLSIPIKSSVLQVLFFSVPSLSSRTTAAPLFLSSPLSLSLSLFFSSVWFLIFKPIYIHIQVAHETKRDVAEKEGRNYNADDIQKEKSARAAMLDWYLKNFVNRMRSVRECSTFCSKAQVCNFYCSLR